MHYFNPVRYYKSKKLHYAFLPSKTLNGIAVEVECYVISLKTPKCTVNQIC